MRFLQLPLDLIHRVVSIILTLYGMQALARLRLVSKAWMAAIQQYSGSAKVSSSLRELDILQRIMPSVSKLYITHRIEGSTTLDLTPLAQFRQLTSLDLSAMCQPHRPYYGRHLNVKAIPNTLRGLDVRGLYLDDGSFSSAAASLTSLKYQRRETQFCLSRHAVGTGLSYSETPPRFRRVKRVRGNGCNTCPI